MDLKQLRITQAPRTTKIIVFGLFLIEVLVGIACAVLTLAGPASDQSSLLQAAAYALGAGMPLFALALLLATAKTGVRAIKAKTHHVLSRVIPAELCRLEPDVNDPASRCQPFSEFAGKPPRRADDAHCQLDLSLNPDGASAFYRLHKPSGSGQLEMWLSVDIALTQVTVCFFVEHARLGDAEKASHLCASTLEGAEKSGGYTVDGEEPTIIIDGRPHNKLILRKKMESDDFLWNPAQMFFFTADFKLMVVSFMNECKRHLVREAPQTPGA